MSKIITPGLVALSFGLASPPALAGDNAVAVGSGGPILIQLDGQPAGYLSGFQAPSYEVEPDQRKMMGAPKIGEATAVFNLSQGGVALDWLSTPWQGGLAGSNISVALADQDYNIKRGIDMGASVITSIEFPALKASDGKKHFEVTARWQPQNLRFTDGTNVKASSAPVDDFYTFSVTVPGFKPEWITSIGLPKVTPKISKESHGRFRSGSLSYDGLEFSSIKIEIGAAGYKSAEDLATRVLQDGTCEESEFQDILIDMKDQSLKSVGTFVIHAGLKKFDWAPKLEGGKEGLATATMEFMVEDFRYKVDHK
jgi:hypothetical protein